MFLWPAAIAFAADYTSETCKTRWHARAVLNLGIQELDF